MGILETLIEKNEFPILFIGSGISKRYLNEFPDWSQLLLTLWKKTNLSETEYYSQVLQIRQRISEESPHSELGDSSFREYIEMASIIERRFNDMFAKGELTIENFTCKDAVSQGISPFKMEIANITKALAVNREKEQEIQSFRKALLKSRTIFTTNYDYLIETIVGNEFNVFHHQADLFLSPLEFGEIFKVHGCSSDPNSIVITQEDYNSFHDNSVLISAKLISFLMVSPIIFLGYSLKDANISYILSRFTQSLRPDQRVILQDRIIYIEYMPGEDNIQEIRQESEVLNAQMTVIRTDNFQYVFDMISQIDQGMPVAQVRMFTERIRKLIIERGKLGSLQTLLISPTDLDDPELQEDRLVVAIGDKTVVFNYPDRYSYLKDYIKETPEISKNVALCFVSAQALATRVPIYKHVNEVNIDNTNLRPDQKEKIKNRLANYSSVQKQINNITYAYNARHNSLQSILDLHHLPGKEMDLIAFNIERINISEVENYINESLATLSFTDWKKYMSQLSRLIVVWDIMKNKKTN